MELTSLNSIRHAALSLANAARYMGAASIELGKIVVPAGKAAICNVPKAASDTFELARNGQTPEERHRAALTLGIAAAVATGFGIATFAHFANKFKKCSEQRSQKRQIATALAREAEIDDMISSALAMRPAEAIIGENLTEDFAYAQGAGCFAVFVYDPDVADEDPSAYRDVYVGASPSMIDGARKQLNGKGNLYVHADMVYKRPVYVAFFPCEEYELYSRREHIVHALGADESYNKVANLAELD